MPQLLLALHQKCLLSCLFQIDLKFLTVDKVQFFEGPSPPRAFTYPFSLEHLDIDLHQHFQSHAISPLLLPTLPSVKYTFYPLDFNTSTPQDIITATTQHAPHLRTLTLDLRSLDFFFEAFASSFPQHCTNLAHFVFLPGVASSEQIEEFLNNLAGKLETLKIRIGSRERDWDRLAGILEDAKTGPKSLRELKKLVVTEFISVDSEISRAGRINLGKVCGERKIEFIVLEL